jgi:hypothetical protein
MICAISRGTLHGGSTAEPEKRWAKEGVPERSPSSASTRLSNASVINVIQTKCPINSFK